MKDKIVKMTEGFNENNIDEIKKYTLDFSKITTQALLDKDMNKLEELIDISTEIRDNIEFNNKVNRNRDFYYGYLFAYENIADRIHNASVENDKLRQAVETNVKFKDLIVYLLCVEAANKKNIIEHLFITEDTLESLAKYDKRNRLNLISYYGINDTSIYTLSPKGRKYFELNK